MSTHTPNLIAYQEFARIPNFTEEHFLDISAREQLMHDQEVKKFVTVSADCGSLRLQHCMTPEQARDFAAELMDAADYVTRQGRFALKVAA